ncbi:transposase [Streptomyces coeruleorubidus]|uniref:RNA-guided endonuclease InsQ/TnpB family protein n=1 Tax=Streptomyces coeruleorubidus TaxID=116188 RepID=UPI00237F2F1D|nr:transposase [Streptomyces coeruleorubidus]WDV51703.1 transposase [Streptomyces coeruleorubidus]
MKLVVQVRLLPTAVQAAALEATLRACNEAATWVSEVAFARGEFKNFALRKLTYEQVKSGWNLGAQAAQHTIKKTCDAYATLKANLRAGRLGRLATLALYRRGESDLVHRDGMWFLNATCEIPEAEPNTDPVDFLGIDLGIVNIATTSDGEIMAGRELNRIRVRERGLRTKLQKKNTPSARRRLNKRRRKEARRAKDINHKIAKHVVAEAECTGRGIALEDLTGIRERVRLRKPQRATHSSWSFHQLGQFIAYKARKAGVPVVYVDPAYTSRTCAECGHIDRANRVSQAWFACRSCGVVAHADRNGSRNIRARAWELWRRGAQSTAPAPPRSRPEGQDANAAPQPVAPVVQARRFNDGS